MGEASREAEKGRMEGIKKKLNNPRFIMFKKKSCPESIVLSFIHFKHPFFLQVRLEL